MKIILLAVALCCTAFPSYCRVVIYNGKPLIIDLPIGKDVVIRFSEPQRVGASSQVKSSINIKPSGNYVTLSANSNEGLAELIFQGMNTGKVVYVRAKSKAENSYYDDEVVIRFIEEEKKDEDKTVTTNLSPREVVASLARSIAQSFGVKYAIEDAAIPIKNVPTQYQLRPIPGLYKQQGVLVSPIKTFFGGGVYGTAFLFENRSNSPVELDPNKFRGDWIGMDILASDGVLRPTRKSIVTLIHLKPLPARIDDIVYGVIQ